MRTAAMYRTFGFVLFTASIAVVSAYHRSNRRAGWDRAEDRM